MIYSEIYKNIEEGIAKLTVRNQTREDRFKAACFVERIGERERERASDELQILRRRAN